MTLTPAQDALRITLDWLNARRLSPEQVRTLRALPLWTTHEQGAMLLVEHGADEATVKAACRKWMLWAQEAIRMEIQQ